MKRTQTIANGSVANTVSNIQQHLHPLVRPMFQIILQRIRQYLSGSNLRLSAPPSEKWITVKLHPRKAVLAFRQDRNGNLKFDIDTYRNNDITDPLGLFGPPPSGKPNKRHVGTILSVTSSGDLGYYIDKMIEGMQIFDSLV
jgi:hypothetical protein